MALALGKFKNLKKTFFSCIFSLNSSSYWDKVRKVGNDPDPGDLLLATPIRNKLDPYAYFDIDIFNQLLNGDLTFWGWPLNSVEQKQISIYPMLELPADFDLLAFKPIKNKENDITVKI
ncbi:MAG: hypothetical protein ACTSVK_12890 [Promethearchaeota archaeon]